MKIIKLPVEYIRFLNEENHVIYGRYEYWMFGSNTVEDVIVGVQV